MDKTMTHIIDDAVKILGSERAVIEELVRQLRDAGWNIGAVVSDSERVPLWLVPPQPQHSSPTGSK